MINISLSIVVPVYKDSYFAEKFIKNVVTFIGSINLSYYEIIFVIDGGSLNDELILLKLAEKHSFVKVIILSRNFGQQIVVVWGKSSKMEKWFSCASEGCRFHGRHYTKIY